MTDGRAVMLGARGRGLGGSRQPCSLPSTGRACVLLMLLPRGRRGGGWEGGLKGACGKWMHRGSSPFCHQTMGLWRMGGTQYDQSSVDQVWRRHSIVFTHESFFFCLSLVWLLVVGVGGSEVSQDRILCVCERYTHTHTCAPHTLQHPLHLISYNCGYWRPNAHKQGVSLWWIDNASDQSEVLGLFCGLTTAPLFSSRKIHNAVVLTTAKVFTLLHSHYIKKLSLT